MEDQQQIPEGVDTFTYTESVEVPTPVEEYEGVSDISTEEGPGLIRRKRYVVEGGGGRQPIHLVAPPAGGPPIQHIRLHKRESSLLRDRILPALLLLGALALIWYFASAPRTYSDERGRIWKLPPGSKMGSWMIPFVGETLDFMHSPFTFGLDHARHYGPVSYSNLLGQDTIVLSGKALTNFYNNTRVGRRGAYPLHIVDLLGGETISMLDEPLHSQRKEWLSKAFGKGFTEGYLDKIEEQVKESIIRWESEKRFYWVSELRRLTSRMAGSILFADPEGGEFHQKNFEEIYNAINSFPWTVPGSSYRAGMNARDQLFYWYIDYAEKVMQGEKIGLEIGRIMSKEFRGSHITMENAIREFHNLALSIYSLHNTLAFMIQAISQHADVFRRAKSEVTQVSSAGDVTPEKLQQLTYLGQLIDEVRRYYPIFPGVFGFVKEGFTIDEYYLPKDAMIFASLYASNHDPEIFDNPHVFDPSRFYQGIGSVMSTTSTTTKVEEPFNYFTHGAGGIDPMGRRCVGEDLTTSIMKIVLVHLLRGWSWTLPSQNLNPKMDSILPIPKGGLYVHSFMQSDNPVRAEYLRD